MGGRKEKMFCFLVSIIKMLQWIVRSFFSPSQKPHSLPHALLSLTLIHRGERIADTVDDWARIPLDGLVKWLQFCWVFDESEEVNEVLVFVCGKVKRKLRREMFYQSWSELTGFGNQQESSNGAKCWTFQLILFLVFLLHWVRLNFQGAGLS